MDRCDIIALRRSTANRIRVQGAGRKVQPPLRATSCIKGAEMIRSVRFICTCYLPPLSPPPSLYEEGREKKGNSLEKNCLLLEFFIFNFSFISFYLLRFLR